MENVPGWIQAVLALAALATALGVIWTKILRPLTRASATGEVMLPLLQDLTVKFRDVPGVFDILKEIVAQVRNDSGSSMKDTIDRLDATLVKVEAAIEQMEVRAMSAAQFLQIGLDTDRKMDERDREQMSRLIREQDRLMDRMSIFEQNVVTIMKYLNDAKGAAEGVALDLAASHERADAIDGAPGEAADAASQSSRAEP